LAVRSLFFSCSGRHRDLHSFPTRRSSDLPLGAYQYSIDGNIYQAGTSFPGLAPGNYTVYVRSNDDNTCVSSGTQVTINAVPDVPANATASVVQPTCAVQTGTITVTAPLGAYQYSIDGNIYQAGTSFPGLAPGNYTVYVQIGRASSRERSGTQVTINAVPDAPANATASVVQPTCAVQTGTITVTAPLGAYISVVSSNW